MPNNQPSVGSARTVHWASDRGSIHFGFDSAREIVSPKRQLYVSGQIGLPGKSMQEQIGNAFRSLQQLLAQAGYTLGHVVRLGLWTTDIEAFLEAWPIVRASFAPGTVPPNTLAQVGRFASAKALVEIEAVALR